MALSASRYRRLPELDLLRGVAILLVLGRHVLWIPQAPFWSAESLFLVWRHVGWIGVDLFFVLSGFLVGGLLIQEAKQYGSIKPGTFLLRRGLKIYPPFYVFLFGSLIIGHRIGFQFSTWPGGFYSEVFFLQSYIAGLWPHTWSLAVEEHFYLLLVGWVLWMVHHSAESDPFRRLPLVVLIVNGVLLLGRSIAAYGEHVHWSVLFFQTHWRLDSLLFGVFLAYEFHFQQERLLFWYQKLLPWRMIVLPILIGPCLVLDLTVNPYVSSIGFSALYLAFGWILLDVVLSSSDNNIAKSRPKRFLAMIGRHSYTIYLWHVTLYYVVILFLHRRLNHHWPFVMEMLAYMVVAITFGMIMSRLVEQPILAWRNRILPSRSNPFRGL